MTEYQYISLTAALKDKSSPLRRYFDTRFPNAGPLQIDYNARSGEIHVQPGTAAPGTLGTAFDLQVRFLLEGDHIPHLATRGFAGQPELRSAVREVIFHAVNAIRGPMNVEALNRACWALALCVEVFRARGVRPGSPLSALIGHDEFTVARLLALAPQDALRQLDELRELALQRLFPLLSDPFHVGPTFEGSKLCAADADLISDGLLIDLKTRAGNVSAPTGVRSDALPLEDVYQVLGYALFDRSDRFRIDSIGIYSARYGKLIWWKLEEALEQLAGERVDLARERETVWELLSGS